MAIEYDDATQIDEGQYFTADVLASILADAAQQCDSRAFTMALEIVDKIRRCIDGRLSHSGCASYLEQLKGHYIPEESQEGQILLSMADILDFMLCNNEEVFLRVLVRCSDLAGMLHKPIGQEFYLKWSKQVERKQA